LKESKLFKSLIATCVVIILGGPTVVLADKPNYFDDAAHAHVSYADLDLESEESVQELYKRLRDASIKVCRVTSPMNAGTMAWRACYRETLSNAIDEFDNEILARIHAR